MVPRERESPAAAPGSVDGATIVVVSHTHWDREWYRSAEEFRLALVDLVDELLDGKADGPFLLDGQTIVLDDYLSVRGDRRDELASALQSGTLEAGPWYVLGDTLVPTGEAIVRNLLEGRRMLRAVGAESPRVLYCPDSFGHTAALPAIAAGFGFPMIVAWRGIGGDYASDTLRWRGDDGSEALLYHLAPDGYELGSALPADSARAAQRWEQLRRVLLPRTELGIALLPNGADHHAVQRRLTEGVTALAAAARPVQLQRASLASFAERLVRRAASARLPLIQGEQRNSTGYTWSLQGTFATRTPQKRENARAERLLLRDVEPWMALARWNGGSSRRAELAALWRLLLACHPHDTLCGCSIDDVARAMDERLRGVIRAGTLAGARAREALVGHDAEAARDNPAAWSHWVVVRNRVPYRRRGIVELDVDVPLGIVPVGPDSAAATDQREVASELTIGRPPLVLQQLSSERHFARVESPRHYPRNLLVERRRYVAWCGDIAPMSLEPLPVSAARDATPASVIVRTSANEMSNDYLRVNVGGEGVTVEVVGGHRYANLLSIEDEGERGDLYTHSPIPDTQRRARLVGHALTRAGPLRGELVTEWEVEVAPRAVEMATEEVVHHGALKLHLTVTLQLDAGARYLRCHIAGRNDAAHHRLRLRVHTGLATPDVLADAAFLPVRRLTRGALPVGDARETVPATMPLHRWVAAVSPLRGGALLSDGLAECQVDDDGAIAVTILRATGDLSRHYLPERPGHAGWPAATPDAQLFGTFEASLAFVPLGGDIESAVGIIERACDDFLLPLRGESLLSAVTPLATTPPLALEGDGLVFSACKESDDGEGIVLRCVNTRSTPVAGAWSLGGVAQAWLARLDEQRLAALPHDGTRIEFIAPPHAIVTIIAMPGHPAR